MSVCSCAAGHVYEKYAKWHGVRHVNQVLRVGYVHEKQAQWHCQIVTRRPLKDTLSGHEGKGLMKVVVNSQNDRVVGIHLVGAEVAEILQVRLFH